MSCPPLYGMGHQEAAKWEWLRLPLSKESRVPPTTAGAQHKHLLGIVSCDQRRLCFRLLPVCLRSICCLSLRRRLFLLLQTEDVSMNHRSVSSASSLGRLITAKPCVPGSHRPLRSNSYTMQFQTHKCNFQHSSQNGSHIMVKLLIFCRRMSVWLE